MTTPSIAEVEAWLRRALRRGPSPPGTNLAHVAQDLDAAEDALRVLSVVKPLLQHYRDDIAHEIGPGCTADRATLDALLAQPTPANPRG